MPREVLLLGLGGAGSRIADAYLQVRPSFCYAGMVALPGRAHQPHRRPCAADAVR